jgi:cytidylate kinase
MIQSEIYEMKMRPFMDKDTIEYLDSLPTGERAKFIMQLYHEVSTGLIKHAFEGMEADIKKRVKEDEEKVAMPFKLAEESVSSHGWFSTSNAIRRG